MEPVKPRRESTVCVGRATVALALCAALCAALLLLGRGQTGSRSSGRQALASGSETPRPIIASSGTVTIAAPSREAIHTTVNHGLGSVPVAVVLGLDLPGFDYYEFTDDRADSSGSPAEIPVHLSALVRKPYNGTFTVRLKHYLGGRRVFTVRWLAVKLET